MAEVNVIMGAGMHSLVVDVVEVNVIMGAGMHSVVSCFAVKTIILQLWKFSNGCYDRGCARNMKMLRANRGRGVGNPSSHGHCNSNRSKGHTHSQTD